MEIAPDAKISIYKCMSLTAESRIEKFGTLEVALVKAEKRNGARH
eukprot:CAMPEP_0170458140 /NCGR_PEP_ID=MMETSP0123-20130129/5199_1 /TAXON_ID=182087 /ORGANISM="Favella ehrenbergii, Strain Fehren 1" /LENGTH=44 /DNA_ID= /DNA_START= /DNA_END= /DNA_ORIENTATION=